VKGIAAGVEYLHSNGVTHNNLKSLSILVFSFGALLIACFSASSWACWASSVLDFMGPSLRIMAPELLISKHRNFSLAVDVWSFWDGRL